MAMRPNVAARATMESFYVDGGRRSFPGKSPRQDPSMPMGSALEVQSVNGDRPRERLARLGAAAVSNRELVALLLGTGHASRSALDVAGEGVADGVCGLRTRGQAALRRREGVG